MPAAITIIQGRCSIFAGRLPGGLPGIRGGGAAGVLPGILSGILAGILVGVLSGRRIVPPGLIQAIDLQGEGGPRQSGGSNGEIAHKKGPGEAPEPCSTLP
jgi:hypothetical protein